MPLLCLFFGLQIAGTIGLAVAGLAANVVTLAMFDRRQLVDIGLHLSRAAGRHFLFGISFRRWCGGFAAARSAAGE